VKSIGDLRIAGKRILAFRLPMGVALSAALAVVIAFALPVNAGQSIQQVGRTSRGLWLRRRRTC